MSPAIAAIAFLLIADIDSPRGGIIRVLPQNLLALSQSTNALLTGQYSIRCGVFLVATEGSPYSRVRISTTAGKHATFAATRKAADLT